MSEGNSIIFVSHAAADAEIASKFKADVEESFLGLCELFVSSNLDSLQGGREWMQEIRHNLASAKIFIGLLSPLALNRPWIYTEFGAGWIREIPTISVCHSGLDKGQLPVPLSHFQALNLTDRYHLEHLYEQISKAIGCQKPARDLDRDVEDYFEITEVLRVNRFLSEWLAQLQVWNPNFRQLLDHQKVEILVPGEADQAFRNFVHEVQARGYLVIVSKGFSMGTSVGMQATNWEIECGANFEDLRSLFE